MQITRRDNDGYGQIAPWAEMRSQVPRGLRIPRWLGATVAGAVTIGSLLGATMRRAGWQVRVARATFFSSAFGYLATSLADFAEHFRMEKEVTGKYLRSVAIPPGETLNHAATVATVVASLLAARPLTRRHQLWTLVAPALFLALGWRDEIVYHRKRATHREDLLHTVPHLAAGIMWTSLYLMRALESQR